MVEIMSSLFKDIYSVPFYDRFSGIAGEVIPSFDKTKFMQSIFSGGWEKKELKERMKHTALVLHDFLPGDFDSSAKVIEQLIAKLRQNDFGEASLEFMFFPEYIERFGLDHFETSIKTIESVTQFTSCEFAVRPFIIKYGGEMINQMLQWSLHKSENVRRLSSEGSRPRLPWAMALPALKNDPAPILPILENLKNDPSEWVRRSVANNLNDISKDNPGIVIDIAKKWKGISRETDAIIKHGCRTLLKQGHPVILEYYQLNRSDKIEVSDFKIINPRLAAGDDLIFSFTLQNREVTPQNIRMEYGVYYLKQNGQHSKKVFKISERTFQPDEKAGITRKQSFRIITTRKFYPGAHKLSIIINGQEREAAEFELIMQ
jgi:3-methyladenine DNA glycosylase AlkC